MKWKLDRYGSWGYTDVLAVDWARRLLERIHATQTTGFAGVLSVLYAGGDLVAAHMGMRSRTLWHYWFPAYNPKYARYSPGLILLLKMAERAEAEGLSRIELGGPDDYLYKRRLMNSEIAIAEGAVERTSIVTTARRWRRDVRRAVKTIRHGWR